ncbi:MAG: hypothetical protein ACOC56_03940 [Atribacterota bacterium]
MNKENNENWEVIKEIHKAIVRQEERINNLRNMLIELKGGKKNGYN